MQHAKIGHILTCYDLILMLLSVPTKMQFLNCVLLPRKLWFIAVVNVAAERGNVYVVCLYWVWNVFVALCVCIW